MPATPIEQLLSIYYQDEAEGFPKERKEPNFIPGDLVYVDSYGRFTKWTLGCQQDPCGIVMDNTSEIMIDQNIVKAQVRFPPLGPTKILIRSIL